jgi:acyl-CoA thioesterase
MSPFDDVTTWTGHDEGWTVSLPASWMQGRGAFGGVVAGAALRAMRSLAAPDRTPRSVSTTFLGPVSASEPAHLTARVLRAGRTITFVEARIVQGGTERAVVQGAFGADRPSQMSTVPPRRPEVAPPESWDRFPYLPGLSPQFIQHLDLRYTNGAFPFIERDGSVLEGYARFEVPAARGPERLLALMDCWPSPSLQQLSAMAPASSVSWTAHLVAPDTVPEGGFVWFRSESVTAGHGYNTILGRLYGPDGTLLAWLEQLAAVFA